eukprot:m.138834 g.138834  ORF g.138834 m.138834 type:complete len:513 (+) comp14014_c0_seq8:1172-2710(+)
MMAVRFALSGVACAIAIREWKVQTALQKAKDDFTPAKPGDHVVVVGAGVVGSTTASHLARAGYRVTLIEAHSSAAQETSHANAGTINANVTSTLASRETLQQGFAEIWQTIKALNPLAPNGKGVTSTYYPALNSFNYMHINPAFAMSAQFISWALNFLPAAAFGEETRRASINPFVKLCRDELDSTVRALPTLSFSYRQSGSLYLSMQPAVEGDEVSAVDPILTEKFGIRSVSKDEVAGIEPCLKTVRYTSALYRPQDRVGNCELFTKQLVSSFTAHQQSTPAPPSILPAIGEVNVRFSSRCIGATINPMTNKLTDVALDTPNGPVQIPCDYAVICAGVDANHVLSLISSSKNTVPRFPIIGVRGYSITGKASTSNDDTVQNYVLFDDPIHAIITRFDDRVRVASHAEFTFRDAPMNQGILDEIFTLIDTILPNCFQDRNSLATWCNFRPLSADSLPIVGISHLPNVLLNIGHGADGWRFAHGTARILTDHMQGNPSPVNTGFLDPARFPLM